jgi:hypothetical protein
MPNNPKAPPSDPNVRLPRAPTNPREFQSLARQMVEILKEGAAEPRPYDRIGMPAGNGEATAAPAPSVSDGSAR